MSPRTPEQFKQIRAEKRQEILDSALKIIAKKGYHATSISSIAKESNISKGHIYNYFRSKEDLLIAIIIDGFKDILENFKIDESITAKENILNLVERTFSVMETMKEPMLVYFSVMLNTEIFGLIKDNLNKMAEPIMAGFIKVMSELGFKNPEGEAFFLRFILDGFTLNYLVLEEHFPKEYCISRIKELYIDKK